MRKKKVERQKVGKQKMKKQKVEKKKMKMKMKMKMMIMIIYIIMKMKMKQWIKTKKNEITKEKKMIFQLKQLTNQNHFKIVKKIKSLKKREDLKGLYPYKDFGDKVLKSKNFKTELSDM